MIPYSRAKLTKTAWAEDHTLHSGTALYMGETPGGPETGHFQAAQFLFIFIIDRTLSTLEDCNTTQFCEKYYRTGSRYLGNHAS